MKKLPSISFLIPAYNDETTIESLIRDSYTVGTKISDDVEVMVVNDASVDRTKEILESLAKKLPYLNVIHHTTNQGYGGAIKTLYYEGAKEWLFTLPGDYQIPPDQLLELVKHTDTADMILGRRLRRMDSRARRRQSWVYNTLLRLFFHLPLTDVNTVRLMKHSMMRQIRLTTRSAFVDAELCIRAIRMGFVVKEVPITHKEREGSVGGGGKLSTIIPTISDLFTFWIFHV